MPLVSLRDRWALLKGAAVRLNKVAVSAANKTTLTREDAFGFHLICSQSLLHVREAMTVTGLGNEAAADFNSPSYNLTATLQATEAALVDLLAEVFLYHNVVRQTSTIRPDGTILLEEINLNPAEDAAFKTKLQALITALGL